MSTVHSKLIEIVVEQTPRAMIAMLIVSTTFVFIFFNFIPVHILLVWLLFQLFLAIGRFYNAQSFKKSLKESNQKKLKKNEIFFIILNLFQAAMWTISSVFLVIYTPQPFELIGFILSIGIITAATLSMSSLYTAYLFFFFAMITPQIMIMLYYGEHQHFALIAFTIIYIPATILLSKSLLDSRISSIEAHDKLHKSAEAFRQLAIVDNLTNIYNRRYFLEVSRKIITIAFREQNKVSFLMLDIDHFKEVNDSFGHQAGDVVLIEIVQNIKGLMRKSDTFARMGGEEFAILANNTSLDGAKVLAEKIRTTIEKSTFIYNSTPIRTTLSIGVSELNQENTTIDQLYKKADKHLYIAKKKGRNRIYPG